MTDTIKDGGRAFPGPEFDPYSEYSILHPGMSLRDWFAGQALAGLLAYYGTPQGAAVNEAPRRAYVIADGMLAAREAKS
jgi:hypothetical protein